MSTKPVPILLTTWADYLINHLLNNSCSTMLIGNPARLNFAAQRPHKGKPLQNISLSVPTTAA